MATAPILRLEKAGLDTPAIRRQCARILASPLFTASPRMARFLEFVVEEALAGNEAAIKESVIASAVFDRAAAHDGRIDPIVRVEARRLRAKLSAYYAGSGLADPVLIEVPPGGYSPRFERRRHDKPAADALSVEPFIVLSGSREDQWLATGVVEDMILALTRNSAYRILAGIQPGAKLTLEGTLRRSGERIRVTVSLVKLPERAYLWSDAYEDEAPEPFAFAERIAQGVRFRLQRPLPIDADAPVL